MSKNLNKLDKLIEISLTDNVISDKERKVILRKAIELKIDEDEVDIYIGAKVHEHQNIKIKKATNMLDISNEELLLRCQKWVSLCNKSDIEVEIEPFPQVKKELELSNDLLKLGGKIGRNIGKSVRYIGRGIKNVAVEILAPEDSFRGLILGGVNSFFFDDNRDSYWKSSRTKSVTENLDNNEIQEIANKYLFLLELRKDDEKYLLERYEKLLAIKEQKVEEFIRTPKKKFGFF